MNENSGAPGGMSRRDALRYGTYGLSGLAAIRLLAACGSDNAGDTNAGTNGSGTSAPASTGATASSSTGSASSLPAVPDDLLPFDSSIAGGPDSGLPRRVAWANTADAEFFLALTKGMEAASKDRDVEFLTAISGNDPQKNISQMEQFLARGIGTLMMQPLDLDTQRPVMERALKDGICVEGLITFPTTLQIAASQYNVGFAQGKAAADYATASLGGKAEVHYFNLDTIGPQLVLRHNGVLDGLKTAGDGVVVVSDITATDISVDGGFSVMNTVIQAHPDIKIVMGGDTLVVGAYNALDQAGKLSDEMYMSGVDGDSQALALVKQGGAYKASVAFAWQLMGYGLGQFGADWIEGKEIPRVMVAAPILLDSADLVDKYLADNASPGDVFANRERYEEYLPLLGNVSFATRENYWQQDYIPK
ncbi:MAG: sugar ABC transporter substrate-binding protein [Gemmatimonadaceae bacterium]|nr:sugar ABC transporter substrate-binding protein [Gemmatimonadaceae bacterium]